MKTLLAIVILFQVMMVLPQGDVYYRTELGGGMAIVQSLDPAGPPLIEREAIVIDDRGRMDLLQPIGQDTFLVFPLGGDDE